MSLGSKACGFSTPNLFSLDLDGRETYATCSGGPFGTTPMLPPNEGWIELGVASNYGVIIPTSFNVFFQHGLLLRGQIFETNSNPIINGIGNNSREGKRTARQV
jgi:hypothetical protein